MQTSAKVKEFIELVKANPVLWDNSYPPRQSRLSKIQTWQRISDECGVPVEACKKKWRGLRYSYIREGYKRNKFGPDSEDEFSYRWKYAEDLDFLKNHISIRNKHNAYWSPANLDADSLNPTCNEEPVCTLSTEITTGTDVLSPSYDGENSSYEDKREEIFMEDSFMEAPKVMEQRITIEETLLDTIRSVQKILNKPRPSESQNVVQLDGEDELFCRFLTEKLRKFPLKVKNDTKEALLQYVNEVENNMPKSVPSWNKFLTN